MTPRLRRLLVEALVLVVVPPLFLLLAVPTLWRLLTGLTRDALAVAGEEPAPSRTADHIRSASTLPPTLFVQVHGKRVRSRRELH